METIRIVIHPPGNTILINRISDKTLFIAFNNCYILSSKSARTLIKAKIKERKTYNKL